MADPVPLLQIIHISDQHVQKGLGDRAGLANNNRRFQSWLREKLEWHDAFEWHEGTLGHDETAASAFEQFLQQLRKKDKIWFNSQVSGPETWLVDTGDATAFGDFDSIRTAHELRSRWESILNPCKVRSLFGNHDAWPSTHPAILAGASYAPAMAKQRMQLRQRPDWHKEEWLKPLATMGGEPLPRIECYGLSTVSFGLLDNILAIGEIEENDLAELKQQILNQSHNPAYRILLTHHPLVFPYLPSEKKVKGLIDKMTLRNADSVVGQLLNASPSVPSSTRSPYIHLVLSGHTHLAYPGNALPCNVKDLYQGSLGRAQAQLVNGSMMLLRSRKAISGTAKNCNDPCREILPDFPGASVFDASQQFQILRFFFDQSQPDGLILQRIIMARVPNDKRGYAALKPLSSTTFVPHSDSI